MLTKKEYFNIPIRIVYKVYKINNNYIMIKNLKTKECKSFSLDYKYYNIAMQAIDILKSNALIIDSLQELNDSYLIIVNNLLNN